MSRSEFGQQVAYLSQQIQDAKEQIHYFKTTDEPLAEFYRNKKINELQLRIQMITEDMIRLRKRFHIT